MTSDNRSSGRLEHRYQNWIFQRVPTGGTTELTVAAARPARNTDHDHHHSHWSPPTPRARHDQHRSRRKSAAKARCRQKQRGNFPHRITPTMGLTLPESFETQGIPEAGIPAVKLLQTIHNDTIHVSIWD
jgi:hypothetical protein